VEPHLTLLPDRLTFTQGRSRRGDIEVELRGAIQLDPSLAWEDTRLYAAVLGAKGEVLATNYRRFTPGEETIDDLCIFQFDVDLNASLLSAAAAVEVWALGMFKERRAPVSMALKDLPKPANGSSTLFRADGFTVQRGTLERDGDVRISVYTQCAFAQGTRVNERGALQLTLFDAAGAVVFHEDERFDTYGGGQGPANIGEYVNLNEPALDASQRLQMQILLERFVTSQRVRVPWSEVVMLRTTDN